MPLELIGWGLRRGSCRARLPFRFGVTTLTEAPLVVLEVMLRADGVECAGYASDLLVPKWFDKNPDTTMEEDRLALIGSIARAAGIATAHGDAPSAFALWRSMHGAVMDALSPDAPDRLVHAFGVSMVERAMIDAVTRATGISFAQAVREGALGLDLGAVHPELAGIPVTTALPEAPTRTVAVRHTVGLADALTRCDVTDRVDDGLPESLEEDVERYGLTWLKIKITGETGADLERLRKIDEVMRSRASGYRFTLDGNEQLQSIEELRRLLDGLDATGLRNRLEYIEQPLPRAQTFDHDRLGGIEALGVPVIIDEADADISSFPRALACGYRGVSVKNCKGVFRALANAALARSRGAFQSAEDLTNLPSIALEQDLTLVATLGLPHVERNGHHYFRGLDHLPDGEAQRAVAAHPRLYARRDGGPGPGIQRGIAPGIELGIELGIERGMLDLGSLVDARGFGGVAPAPGDWAEVPIPEGAQA